MSGGAGRRALLLGALALPAALAALAQDAVLKPGEPAPGFSLPGRDAQPVTLSALRGRLVLLHFWASWCPACQQSFPWLNALQSRYAAAGLQVLGIGVDSRRADADAFVGQHPAQFLLAFDGADLVPRSYDVRVMPSLLLIDAQGRLLQAFEGFTPAVQAALERRIRAALPPR